MAAMQLFYIEERNPPDGQSPARSLISCARLHNVCVCVIHIVSACNNTDTHPVEQRGRVEYEGKDEGSRPQSFTPLGELQLQEPVGTDGGQRSAQRIHSDPRTWRRKQTHIQKQNDNKYVY